jgi:hypothetical protein
VLVEETNATLRWTDDVALRGVTVVWSEPDDREAFEAWAANVAHAYPQHFVLTEVQETMAREAPWRGILFAPGDAKAGGSSERTTLEFRGHEYPVVVLTPRVSSAAWLADAGRPSLEVPFIGIEGGGPTG